MRYRPIELRIKLFDEVRRLRGQGASYGKIINEIERMCGVTLSKSQISYWVRGLRNPSNDPRRIPPLDHLRPSEELAYVIGAIVGDGYVCQKLRNYYYRVVLTVKDLEFAEEFARCIAKVIGREPPKSIPGKDGVFVVEVGSKTLYELLKKPVNIDRIRQYIEHCINCVSAFLWGFFDSEGSIYGNGKIRVYNSDKPLLEYIKDLLNRLGIKTTGPKIIVKAGTPCKSPTTGKTYFTRKDVSYLYIHAESRLRFYQLIGFTVKRKQQRLEEYLIRRGVLKKREEVLMCQTA
jgi:intein-encoded DNA endonuclease-like protein